MNRVDPFTDLELALTGAQSDLDQEELAVRIDRGRRHRTGAPEVVYCTGKSPDQVVSALQRLVVLEGRAVAARCTIDQAQAVAAEVDPEFEHEWDAISQLLVVWLPGHQLECARGRVAIVTAGASDRCVAAEAAGILREMGCETMTVHDVGVAGLHRLVQPLRDVIAFDPDALIVAAGMDGVLPGVIAGLVPLPVIGLPTSTGYGFGGDGLGAMTTMLQACSPGIAVVNIDNGVGAAVTAGLIANRAADQRSA